MSETEGRPVAAITGASGGMGAACARQLGKTHDLVLNDIDADGLNALTETLQKEGYVVAGVAPGSLVDAAVVDRFCAAIAEAGRLGPLVHTAGVSPIQADWRTIIEVDLIACEFLVRAVRPLLRPGSVAVLIASNAGHSSVPNPVTDALIDDPLAPGMTEALYPHIVEALKTSKISKSESSMAYGFAKRGVIRLCEGHAVDWAAAGARIVSISPGVTWTPMARREVDKGSIVSRFLDIQGGRWGTAMDIANAVDFLVSDKAGFITGCDLRVDGGGSSGFAGVRF
jgi:NAD(P)-dependent dehydrogenase (short-subunit alcohol dehydrogenase family)